MTRPDPIPRRGDAVATWLTRARDSYGTDVDDAWRVLNDLLDAYHEHADAGTPLGQDLEHRPAPGPGPRCECGDPIETLDSGNGHRYWAHLRLGRVEYDHPAVPARPGHPVVAMLRQADGPVAR